MKYLSLFSGVGGFELGIQQAYEDLQRAKRLQQGRLGRNGDMSDTRKSFMASEPLCIGYSEIDKYAIQVYNKHFNHKNYGDITKIQPESLPNFDLIVGGFPCQSFSIAGKRGGFNDTRGTLFFEIARIIKQKQPRLLLLENVKGLLSHDQGRTFTIIISTLDELGYDCQWQVLNSKNFGVPQNRERVFIVGHLRGTSRPEVFPIGESTGKIIEDVETIDGYNKNYRKYYGSIRTNAGCHTTGNLIQLNKPKHSNDRIYSDKGLSPTLNTMQGGNRQPFIVAQRGRYPENPKSRVAGLPTKQMLEPNLKGVSNTLSTVQKDNMLCDKDSKIRRLTPKECERLQGFPDDWTKLGILDELKVDEDGRTYKEVKEISNNQRYKMVGNAVSVPVIKEIIKKLI